MSGTSRLRPYVQVLAGGATDSATGGGLIGVSKSAFSTQIGGGLAINTSGYIFAGGDPLVGPVGVLRSTDNGDTWQPVNNGLTTENGINALMATSNGYLFAGTYGDGVFRSTDNGDNWTLANNGLTAQFCSFIRHK